jgi:uncharacterized membrane protein YjgN (DUF898 family)
MTRRFTFSLSAAKLFPLYVGFYIPLLVLYALLMLGSLRIQEHRGSPEGILLYLGASLGLLILYLLFAIPFLRRILPALSLEGRPLAFRGSMGRFVGLNLLGAFLSLITLGIYAPWYITRVSRYLAGETSFDGRPWEFSGKGGKLFVILLLTLFLPTVIIAVLVGVYAALAGTGVAGTRFLSFAVVLVVLVILMPPYLYEVYRWFFTGLRLPPLSVGWRTRFWPAAGAILLQIMLSLVTLGIYLPAAYVKLYRYFARHTVLMREGESQPYGEIGFDGQTGQGFLLMWGQSLLTIVTLGFYGPWAAARIGRWFAERTLLETVAG